MEELIPLHSTEEAFRLFASQDRNLRRLRERYGVELLHRGEFLKLMGERPRVEEARPRIESALALIRAGEINEERIWLELAGEPAPSDGNGAESDPRPRRPTTELLKGRGAASFAARTEGQARYLAAMERYALVLAVGPAGTGKTFLAVLAAVRALEAGRVRRIVLVRPAVEAGEKLGFLPGDMYAKVNPYLRPLHDALRDILDPERLAIYQEDEIIEIVPLAYMRGRTLNRSYIIMDEAQNTTPAQMQMFLTRMGEGSRIVVTGDITQIDLPHGVPSGMVSALRILDGIDGIAQIHLTAEDIVRHPLVTKIVEAYAAHDKRRGRR